MKIAFTEDHVLLSDLTPQQKHMAVYTLDATKLKKACRLPKHLWSMREVAKAFPETHNDSTFIDEGKKLRREVERLSSIKGMTDHGFVRDFMPNLRPYQRHDVTYLRQLPAAGIFNEPRTGKTPTVISLIKELGTKRNLIVAPASLIWNWAKEFEQWYPECHIFMAVGTPKQREKIYTDCNYQHDGNSVLIISKDTLKSDDTARQLYYNACIVDEAHFLRNYKSAQSKAIYQIKADRKYVLTGTPTVKHPSDIFGIMHFLYPKKFASYWQFCLRYFQMGTDWMGHNVVGNPRPERVQELQEMIALLSTQRKRKEVMPWLPDKQRSSFTIQMEGKQRKLYDEMAKFFLASDPEFGVEVDTLNVISQLMRLRQLCLDPRLLGFDCSGIKTQALLEYLDTHRAPVVIMSSFTSYLKLLKPEIEALGLKVGEINGEMGNNTKHAAAESFQRGEVNVLLCNIISAGTGFTLDRSGTVIFTDKAWNPSENDQAEDRVTPTTEEKNHKHEIITFTCMNSVDARIDEVLSQKKSLTDYINEGGREALTRLLRG